MQKELRLVESRRYSAIYQDGLGWANNFLVLRTLPNERPGPRFGLVTARRVGNAVTRNKVRRRLKELLRATRIKPGWDLVFIVRRRATMLDYRQLQFAAWDLLKKANLLECYRTER